LSGKPVTVEGANPTRRAAEVLSGSTETRGTVPLSVTSGSGGRSEPVVAEFCASSQSITFSGCPIGSFCAVAVLAIVAKAAKTSLIRMLLGVQYHRHTRLGLLRRKVGPEIFPNVGIANQADASDDRKKDQQFN
jgi:uncharacterized metal-binding protein